MVFALSRGESLAVQTVCFVYPRKADPHIRKDVPYR